MQVSCYCSCVVYILYIEVALLQIKKVTDNLCSRFSPEQQQEVCLRSQRLAIVLQPRCSERLTSVTGMIAVHRACASSCCWCDPVGTHTLAS